MWISKAKREIKEHILVYGLLTAVIAAGLFLRVYRVNQILGFYYDQGRDALVIWEFWHKGKFFLVGPTTGIAGIFRGPFYYYLIAPFYFVGGGDPSWPAVFLAVTSVMAIGLAYYLGMKIQDRVTGLLAAIISSFSFYMVMAGRWLSNPTPMLLLSMILVWMMILVTEGKRWAWVVIALTAGLSLFHFGSAGEVFYFGAIGVLAIWQRKNLPKGRWLLISIGMLALTAMPQVLFDLRHGGILRENIKKFLFEEGSFKITFWEVVKGRTNFYYDVFTNKIFHWKRTRELIALGIIAAGFVVWLPKFLKNDGVKVVMLLLISPMVGLVFFQGNFGNIYDYYLTGYYLVFILGLALVLGKMWRWRAGKIFVAYFLYIFLSQNTEVLRYKITDGVDGPESVAFKNEKQAVTWVYADANGREFNSDVYVPPVIPYAYDYLFTWLGSSKYGHEPKEEQIALLYTIYEVDPPHPERLEVWLKRQEGIGEVEEEVKFGGITVQRRTRISN